MVEVTNQDLEKYLKRLDYSGTLEPTITTLRQLHRVHLRTIPFENLDIHLGREIALDETALFDKIIIGRRGGFCYELNGLFAWLLRALGFEVTLLSAAVAKKTGGFGPEFDHMTLLVSLEEPWLVDVGFGDSFLEPLRLNNPDPSVDESGAYRITKENDYFFLARQDQQMTWQPQYRFTLRPRETSEYLQMCVYHQTSPDSSFTRGRICTKATPGGRVSLAEMRLVLTDRGRRREQALADEQEYSAALLEHFGIALQFKKAPEARVDS